MLLVCFIWSLMLLLPHFCYNSLPHVPLKVLLLFFVMHSYYYYAIAGIDTVANNIVAAAWKKLHISRPIGFLLTLPAIITIHYFFWNFCDSYVITGGDVTDATLLPFELLPYNFLDWCGTYVNLVCISASVYLLLLLQLSSFYYKKILYYYCIRTRYCQCWDIPVRIVVLLQDFHSIVEKRIFNWSL